MKTFLILSELSSIYNSLQDSKMSCKVSTNHYSKFKMEYSALFNLNIITEYVQNILESRNKVYKIKIHLS